MSMDLTYMAITDMNDRCPNHMSREHLVTEGSTAESNVRTTLNRLDVITIHIIEGWDAFSSLVLPNFMRIYMKNNIMQRLRAASRKRAMRALVGMLWVVAGGRSGTFLLPDVPYMMEEHPPVTVDCSVLSSVQVVKPVSVVHVPTLLKRKVEEDPLPG